MMLNKDIPKEYSKRINTVVNFILKNFQDELSLSKLAGIANYSPFHFQKIFKQVTGESPKQFIIRMRLESSAHFLITHRHKSITEIALAVWLHLQPFPALSKTILAFRQMNLEIFR